MPSFEFADWFNGKSLKLLAVAVIYTLAYRLVADYLAPQGRIDLFFIASGVALAALLLGGRIYALSVFFGCVLANLWGGLSLWIAVSIATGCTLNALLGSALVIHKKSFDLSLKSLPDYLRLIFFGGFFYSHFFRRFFRSISSLKLFNTPCSINKALLASKKRMTV